MVQLRARPGALGELRGPELHRPPAHQAQGGQLGPALQGPCRRPSGWRLLAAIMAVEAERPVTVSRWHEDVAAHAEAFACLQELHDPSSFATTMIKAIRKWGQGLLRLSAALAQENAALERENAALCERIAELERSAALDSSTSSKPPASDGPGKKNKTPRRTQSQRGKSGRPSGGQPGHKGTTLARTGTPDHVGGS